MLYVPYPIKNKGFTLVELMVVMAIFLFIIAGAIGIFISIIQYERRILAEQELLNQMSYVIEYMSKALRMAGKDGTGDCLGEAGYSYLLTRPDSTTGFYRGIKFINASDNYACQEFYLDNYVSQGGSNITVLKEKKVYPLYVPVSDENAVALTSEKFKITSLRFGINGTDGRVGGTYYASDDDAIQPKITILLDIQPLSDSDQEIKKIQTTISQRKLNTQ